MNESNKMAANLMPLLAGLPQERQESFKVVLTQALNISYKEGKFDGAQEAINRWENSMKPIAHTLSPIQTQPNGRPLPLPTSSMGQS